MFVVKIQTGDGIARLGLPGFFFDADSTAVGVELDDPIALGVGHGIGEYRRASADFFCVLQQVRQFMAIEQVIPQYQG